MSRRNLDRRFYKLNMSRMFIMHDALRRELERIARVTTRPSGHEETGEEEGMQ